MKRPLAHLVLAGVVLFAAVGVAAEDSVQQVIGISARSNEDAQNSQQEIDRIADQTRDLLGDYTGATKQLDGLQLYNAYLERQIANQQTRLDALDAAFGDVSGLQRQIVPLMVRMIDGLEQFIALDLPFRLPERNARIAALRKNLDRPETTLAEKYNAVLEAYRSEDNYGRGSDTWRDTVAIDGVEREVDMLRIGRVALLYSSAAGDHYGFWNARPARWQELDDSGYRDAILDGIRMANRQGPATLLRLPIAAPEPSP